MESGKLVFVAFATFTLFLTIGSTSAKPTMEQQWINNPQQPISHYDLHPIDNCIFACDHCYKSDALVKCANECIMSEATMGIEWTTTCPYLSRQYTHPSNPFRN